MHRAVPSIASMAKVELNVHLNGTVPSARALALAEVNRATDLLEMPDGMLEAPRTLEEFLYAFDAVGHVLRTPDDLRRAVGDHLRAVAAQGVVHTELLWSPMVHLDDGLPYRAQLAGLRLGIEEATAETGTTCRLLATVDRERPVDDAEALLDLVLEHRDDLVVGLGLAYGEQLRAAPFAGVFQRALAAGLRTTAFAGETGDAHDVGDCVGLLGCQRISHGYAALRNRRVKARVRDEGIHFVVTPATISRLRGWGFPDTGGVWDMVDAGFRWSISTNNPARYGTDLVQEYEVAHGQGVSLRQLETSVEAAVDASFLDDAERADLRRRVAARAG